MIASYNDAQMQVYECAGIERCRRIKFTMENIRLNIGLN